MLVILVILPLRCLGWHDPHVIITRAAILSLPVAMQGLLAAEAANLSEVYSFYPDRYRNASALEKAFMRKYCEMPGGKPIHNVTWDRAFDVESVEYLFEGIITSLRAGNRSAMAQYAGTLAHLLEDSLSPPHAMDLRLLQELVPPSAHARKLYVHAPMELSCPDFDLGGRAPLPMGTTVRDAACAIIDRTYTGIRQNRNRLIELLQAVYNSDTATMDRLRLLAARAAAELYADALHAGLVLAGQGIGADLSTPGPRKASRGVDVQVAPGHAVGEGANRLAALNLMFGLREAVRLLKVDQRVLRTRLGVIIVRAPDPRRIGGRSPESGWVEILGNWPPDTGSMVTQIWLDSAARLASLRTVVDGAPELGEQRVPFGEWIRTVDHRGDPLFEVNASSGSVLVRNHERLVCTLKPRDASFASGVLLETQGHEPLSIQVSGRAGQLRVAVSGRELETFPAQDGRP